MRASPNVKTASVKQAQQAQSPPSHVQHSLPRRERLSPRDGRSWRRDPRLSNLFTRGSRVLMQSDGDFCVESFNQNPTQIRQSASRAWIQGWIQGSKLVRFASVGAGTKLELGEPWQH